MMSEVLVECLKTVLLTCAKTLKGHCLPSLKYLDYLLIAQSLGIMVYLWYLKTNNIFIVIAKI